MNMINIINLNGSIWMIKRRNSSFMTLYKYNQNVKYYMKTKTLVHRNIITGKFQAKKILKRGYKNGL